MRKLLLPLLLVLLLLSLLTAAASAQADDAEFGDEIELEAESDECVVEDEEDVQICAEIAEEEKESEEIDRCVIEDATATLVPHPGSNTIGLAIRYESVAPAAVLIEARLRGAKGKLRLGADHAHLRRDGVYRKSFILSEKEMDRALGAREFEVRLQALNTPRYCQLDLNGAPRRARH